MSQQFNVAVLGANSAAGKSVVELLESRNFPTATLFPLAIGSSDDDVHEAIRFNGKNVDLLDAQQFDWSQTHLAFFTGDIDDIAVWAERAAESGCVVINNNEQLRGDDIPLVIPEVNPELLADFRYRNIIATPSAVTIGVLVALKPLHDAVGIARINVATYQSVSGSGDEGVKELADQCNQLLNGRSVDVNHYSQQIAFNVIPQVDEITDTGYSRAEMNMVWEIQRILGDSTISVNPSCVRVPIFYGDAAAIHVELQQPLDVEQVKALLQQAASIQLYEEGQGHPTPTLEAVGQDQVLIGRLRQDLSHPCGINMWMVTDNLRKGTATNSVQIAELLVRDYL